MNKKIFITNRTNKKILAKISDMITGSDVLKRVLAPGRNEIKITHLNRGTYNVQLIDDNNDIYYHQKIVMG